MWPGNSDSQTWRNMPSITCRCVNVIMCIYISPLATYYIAKEIRHQVVYAFSYIQVCVCFIHQHCIKTTDLTDGWYIYIYVRRVWKCVFAYDLSLTSLRWPCVVDRTLKSNYYYYYFVDFVQMRFLIWANAVPKNVNEIERVVLSGWDSSGTLCGLGIFCVMEVKKIQKLIQ